MTNFPKFEVAISDADRAEIEAMYIELMRERDTASTDASDHTAANHSPDLFTDSGT